MKLLVLLFSYMGAFGLTIDELAKSHIEYKLQEGSNLECPAPYANLQKDRKSILFGGSVYIGDLNSPPRISGKAGLSCFLNSESDSCKIKKNVDYFTNAVSSISNEAMSKGERVVKVSSSAEAWYYKDKIRTLHTKEVLIGDTKMSYRAGVFLIKSDKRSFDKTDLKMQKDIRCEYVK